MYIPTSNVCIKYNLKIIDNTQMKRLLKHRSISIDYI